MDKIEKLEKEIGEVGLAGETVRIELNSKITSKINEIIDYINNEQEDGE